MSFFKKVGGVLLASMFVFSIVSSVFAVSVDIDADCSGVKDGVVTCTLEGDTFYAECYRNEALQAIGADSVWQKATEKQLDSWNQEEVNTLLGACAHEDLVAGTSSYIGDQSSKLIRGAVAILILILLWFVFRSSRKHEEK